MIAIYLSLSLVFRKGNCPGTFGLHCMNTGVRSVKNPTWQTIYFRQAALHWLPHCDEMKLTMVVKWMVSLKSDNWVDWDFMMSLLRKICVAGMRCYWLINASPEGSVQTEEDWRGAIINLCGALSGSRRHPPPLLLSTPPANKYYPYKETSAATQPTLAQLGW